MPNPSRGITFIGAVVIAVAFLIAILVAVSWIISAQQTQFKRPNMVVEKAETFSAGNGIWLEIKNYGIETTRLEKVYVYDPEYGKYYIAYPNGTTNNVIDPETGAIVGSMEAKPLSASEGGVVYVKILFNAGVLRGNLITGIAVFDKTLAPWKLYRTAPPITKPGYTANAWRVKLFIFNPSDFTIFTDNRSLFLPGTVTKLPVALILINKYTSFAGHFFNWTCGLAQAYGWTPGSDVRFTDAYRNVELPFYRYYFNCTSYTAIFIVYLKNVTIFPRQTYPIYLWYAPWVAGGGIVTITDKSNETVYYIAVNNSAEDLFKSPPAWDYDAGLRSKIRWVRDTTANVQMSPIYDYQGDIEDLNLTYYGDWVWDDVGQDHIVCNVDPANGDYRCTIVYLNLTDGFFERFQIGDWYFYQYPEGYSWLMEVAFNQTLYPAQEPFNQTYIMAMSPMLFYRYGWWFGIFWTGDWYGWIAKTFAATAANWAIIVSGRSLSDVTPPNVYMYHVEKVEKLAVVNTTIVSIGFRFYALNPTRTYLNITPGATVRVVVYNDTNANRIVLNITDLWSGNSWIYRIVPDSDSSFMVVEINSTEGYVKTFINAFGWTVYYRDDTYPSITGNAYYGFPPYSVITYFLWPRYFGVWWVASWYNDLDDTIWVGNEIEASLKTSDLSVLNFSKLHRLVYSYTSGADLVGSQFVWMGIASEGNSIDDDLGRPPPLQFITAEASGAYGDELIEGNTVAFSTVDIATRDINNVGDPEVQVDWIRVIIGLGYIWWEGPVLDQWPF